MASGNALQERGFGLRTKFVLSAFILTLLISSLIVAFQLYVVRGTMNEQTSHQGASIADTIASTSGYYVTFGLVDDLKSILADLEKNPTVEYADFLSTDGSVLASTKKGKLPAGVDAKLPKTAEVREVKLQDGKRGQIFFRPFYESREITADMEPRGCFRLVVNDSEANAAFSKLFLINIAVALGALAIAMFLASIVAKLTVAPILQVIEQAGQVAGGDLTRRAEITSRDEVGVLGHSFNTMAGNLEKTLAKIRQSQGKLKSVADTVGSRSQTVIDRVEQQGTVLDEAYSSIDKLNGGIRKISENVEALSASSEETSSSILEMVASMEEVTRHTDTLFESVEETASATHEMVSSITEVDQNVDFLKNFVTETSASMVEMSASIGQVERSASRSHELAMNVTEAAESGMKAVRETMEGMEQIRKSVHDANGVVSRLGDRSAEIGKILNVIDDIAEQTNLLALNASILAAQAGEHGKGFSVVAAEIRDLSERTATSTKEIGSLIHAVQEEVQNALDSMSAGARSVEGGVMLANDAGKALNRILDSAQKSLQMGREIAGAMKEQAKGSETVAKSIERVQDMVKQINAATNQQAMGSDHILKAVEQMREVTKYVRQATIEQKSGSVMISKAAERMIDMVHEIFGVTADQASESEKIVRTMEQVRDIAESNRRSAGEMNETVSLLGDAIRELDEEVRKFRIRT
ncbi:MAG: methyl-accepting chemotaxis protein [Thermoanaerobaculia bacterium]|jgi:methyl-accepting chemotaxis protein